MKRKIMLGFAIAAVAVLAVATLATNVGAATNTAVATLRDASGSNVGSVRFSQRDGIVTVVASARNIASGFHGFHVHDAGICDANAVNADGAASPFFTAGPHYKAAGTSHPDHAGDMPVLLALGNKSQSQSFRTDRFTVAQLLEGNGSAVIVHAGPDDYTQPATGNAGARIVCGVVTASK